MICNNCGKQIKDISQDKCSKCGQTINIISEGNGFCDILPANAEGIKTKDGYERMSQEEKNDKLILELINTRKETNKILKNQVLYKQISLILAVVYIVVSVGMLISFMDYSAKIDTLNEKLSNIQNFKNEEFEESSQGSEGDETSCAETEINRHDEAESSSSGGI